MTEIWKQIIGWEGLYDVSNTGRVRSKNRTVPHRRWGVAFYKGKILNHGITKKGYHLVVLSKRGKTKSFHVHFLVLRNFVGEAPFGMQACHRDDNKNNNRLDNLRWDTLYENMKDRKRNRQC